MEESGRLKVLMMKEDLKQEDHHGDNRSLRSRTEDDQGWVGMGRAGGKGELKQQQVRQFTTTNTQKRDFRSQAFLQDLNITPAEADE